MGIFLSMKYFSDSQTSKVKFRLGLVVLVLTVIGTVGEASVGLIKRGNPIALPWRLHQLLYSSWGFTGLVSMLEGSERLPSGSWLYSLALSCFLEGELMHMHTHMQWEKQQAMHLQAVYVCFATGFFSVGAALSPRTPVLLITTMALIVLQGIWWVYMGIAMFVLPAKPNPHDVIMFMAFLILAVAVVYVGIGSTTYSPLPHTLRHDYTTSSSMASPHVVYGRAQDDESDHRKDPA